MQVSRISKGSRDGVHLSLVVPIWNGAEKLSVVLPELAQWIADQSFGVELVLANDGSGPATSGLLKRFAAEHERVVLIDETLHKGKGAAVAAGMLAARGDFRIFVDSDLAYPLTEVTKILQVLESGVDVAVACRVLPESRYLMSPTFFHYLYTRHLMSRFFNAVTRALLLPRLSDTQAGLKGFSANAVETIFQRLTISGFGFDLECLYIARVHDFTVSQVPVLFQYDDEPSTVRFLHDALEMIGDVVTIRLRGPRYYRASIPKATLPAAAVDDSQGDLEAAS